MKAALTTSRSALAMLAAGASVSAGGAAVAFHQDHVRWAVRDADARDRAVEALRVLRDDLTSDVVDVSRLFAASRSVSLEEFRRFTEPVVGPGRTVALTWSPRGPGGSFRTRYAVPAETVTGVAGPDADVDPARGAAIRRAVRSGRPASTTQVRLAAPRGVGYVIFAPVPGRGRAAPRGVVSGSFPADEVRTALKAAGAGAAVEVTQARATVYARGRLDSEATPAALDFAGQRWTVRASVPHRSLGYGAATAAIGSLLTLLLVAGVRLRVHRAMSLRRRRDHETAERRFLDTFASAPIGMALVSPQGEVVRVNDSYCTLLGRSRPDVLRSGALDLLASEDRAAAAGQVRDAVSSPGTAIAGEFRARTPLGARWVESHATYLEHEGLLLIQCVDVDDRRRLEGELRHQADHDDLTGLLNRRGFLRAVARHLDGPVADGGTAAVMVLDLDHFKAINDLHGHDAGDEALHAVAQVLRHGLEPGDQAARLGSDEFAVLLSGIAADGARVVAGRLMAALSDDLDLAAMTRGRAATACAGVVMLDASTVSPDGALIAADLAMHDAREAGRGRCTFFDSQSAVPSMTQNRLEWVERIRWALAHDRLHLVAQPIRGVVDDRVHHYELLVRMTDADGRERQPGEFLPIAEQLGLVAEIDVWVARQALELLHRHADPELCFHINLSGRTVGDRRILDALAGDLASTGVDPSRLVIEVTETAAVGHFEHARAFLDEIVALGCRLALDDFGAGFGSFVYVKQLPFDTLKIDGEFVRNLASDERDRTIMESLVRAARGLGKSTVAEFVEDQQTEDFLRALGVDFLQGYHIGRPAPLEIALAGHGPATSPPAPALEDLRG